MTVPDEVWIVEWTYSSANHFEEPMQFSYEGYELTIQDGKAKAKASRQPPPELLDAMHTNLNNRFRGIQLVSHKPYKLSSPSVTCIGADGKGTLSLKLADPVKVSENGDRIIIDKEGNVVSDTKAERISRMRDLSTLAAKYGGSDTVAGKILQSYNNAIDDADNCLVHLYEIRDALAKHFGGEQGARNALKVPKKQWQELGTLANTDPLKQGRHRGEHIAELREATEDELNRAMNIAAKMIEQYLKHLDQNKAAVKSNQ
jgi:hypothetical protein